ncbi:MAG: Fe-S cluster assembly protein SufD [Leptolyngbya sp. PLA3]|nr:MAG: Fe-S cluster assembly protein SufD [Cyanobacteria bacterium CYA]MCE7968812.1 Fe-S cluster assembly protein SufD [Leptolyngbya sp. PL-A3]
MTSVMDQPVGILTHEPPPAPEWVQAFRAQSRQALTGLPTLRDEAWRYTNLAPITGTNFVLESTSQREMTRADVARLRVPELDAAVLVFVDGRFRPELSDKAADLGAGVTCATLGEAFERHADLVRPHLGAASSEHDDPFTRLNDAMLSAGVFVHVADGIRPSRPIEILSIATRTVEPVAAHPRNLIVVGKGGRVTVLEHYIALDEGGVYLNNAVTELIAGDGAFVEHYLLERESERAFNVSTLAIRQGAQGVVHSHTVLLGGAIVRNNVVPVLAGEGAHCLINGLYVGHGDQHLDNAMRVRHAAARCESRQYYKGIMNGRSRGVFTGRIVVDKGAQKTDAIQTNRNMLLSDDARVNARPQLEIYADDVRCTHGATTGRVDDEAVFYFRSRGLSEPVARAMLVYAFAAEGFDRMELVPVRRLLAREMIDKLPMARGLSIEV